MFEWDVKSNYTCLFFSNFSGLLLWIMCAVCFVGPGAVQPSLLFDTTRTPSHASRSPAVPAGLESGHAGG